MNKDYDKDQVIETLMSENSNFNRMIQEAKYEMSAIPEIEGLPLVSAVKLLKKMYLEAKKKAESVDKPK